MARLYKDLSINQICDLVEHPNDQMICTDYQIKMALLSLRTIQRGAGMSEDSELGKKAFAVDVDALIPAFETVST